MSKAPTNDDAPVQSVNPRPIRVLVVDDSFSFRSALVRLLRREPGIVIVGHTNTGHRAVRLTSVLRPDVVLMDIAMRGMDGIEATGTICTECPSVSVIAVSSFAVGSEQATAMQQAGAVGYVCKGVDGMGHAVIAAIRKNIEQRAQLPRGRRVDLDHRLAA